MRFVKPVSYVFLIVAFLTTTLLTGCNQTSGEARGSSPTSEGTPAAASTAPSEATPMAEAVSKVQKTPSSVEVKAVTRGGISEVLTYSGGLQAKDTVNVVPKVSGEIKELLVDVGSQVKKGDVIARIDSQAIQAQVSQAEAALSAAQASLETLQNGARSQEIAIAEAQVRQAEANYAQLIATPTPNDLNILKAQMKRAEITLEDAQRAYDEVSWRGDIKRLPESIALEQASIAYQAALATYNNAVEGARPNQRAASRAGVDAARYQLDLRKNMYTAQDLAKAKAGVDQAKAALELARLQLEWTAIKAPFDGVVSQRYLSVGAVAASSTPIVSVVSNDLEVALSVEEARLSQLRVGQAAAIRVNAYPGRDFSAVISNISPTADQNSHTFTVKVYPKDEESLLKSGMFADTRLLLEQKGNALLVPKSALVYSGNKVKVFVVKDDVAVEHEVTVGLSDTDLVEVSNGLVEGDQVIVSGQAALANGDQVRIVSGSPAAASVSIQ